jgi:hypothetical protein
LVPSTETVIRCAAVSIAIRISARAVLAVQISEVTARASVQQKLDLMP